MRNVLGRLLVVFLMAGAGAGAGVTAAAQQTLNVYVQEKFETLKTQRDSVGCFDVLAALRLQSEIADGAFTHDTKQAFSTGACVVTAQGVSLNGAQSVEIDNASLFRGKITDVDATLYFPEDFMNVGVDNSAATPLSAIAEKLRRRVGEMERCSDNRDDLDSKIDEFNTRLENVLVEKSEAELTTGSRLERNKTATITAVELADEKAEALHLESLALQAQATAHNERCAIYEAGIVLDQDYMAYYQATVGAEL